MAVCGRDGDRVELARSSVGATRVYLLEVDACKVLLTEHRSGNSMIVLSRTTPPS